MLIPSLLNLVQVSVNDGTDPIQLASVETMIVRKLNGFKPELTRHPFAADVNVQRFVAVEAVEIDAVWARYALNGGHAD
jgi:hypothetical protein